MSEADIAKVVGARTSVEGGGENSEFIPSVLVKHGIAAAAGVLGAEILGESQKELIQDAGHSLAEPVSTGFSLLCDFFSSAAQTILDC